MDDMTAKIFYNGAELNMNDVLIMWIDKQGKKKWGNINDYRDEAIT